MDRGIETACSRLAPLQPDATILLLKGVGAS